MNKFLKDEEELKAMEMPPMQIEAERPPVDYKEYLARKYNLAGLGDDKRAALESQVEQEKSGATARAMLAAFGTSLTGGNAQAAAEKARRGQAIDELEAFDKKRLALTNQDDKETQWNAKQREEDPSSPESRMAQDLAKSMGFSGDVSGITAAKFKQLSPVLQKKYEIEQRKIADNIRREDKKEADEIRREEKALREAPMKQNEALAAGFGKRILQSENDFAELEASGYNRADVSSGIASSILPNVMRSSESQRQEQAERNFVNAVLRRESGAAISATEFDSAEKQYFPRAGDSKETLEQKARNRKQVLESFKAEAGKGWDKIPEVAKKNKTLIKKQQNKKTNQTKYVYSDGSEEIIDGLK